MKKFILLNIFVSLAFLTACSGGVEEDEPLPGERISIFDLEKNTVTPEVQANKVAIALPEIWANKNWPQAGGYPNHSMQNLALPSQDLRRSWKADIGEGTTNQVPLNAQPIVVAGQAFTLDTKASVRAFDTQSGKLIWRTSIQKETEKDRVISGGMSFANNIIYITSGFSEVIAINPVDGQILWRSKTSAPSRAAPTISEGRVFVTTMNNNVIALDGMSGKIIWEHEGVSKMTGLLGAASPSVDAGIVIAAFSSGELVGLRAQNGSLVWSDNLAKGFKLGGVTGLSDIRALPIIDNGRVIAISFGGSIMALDKETGARIWRREISGGETPWIAGQTLYLISEDNVLTSLNIQNGAVLWTKPLQRYKNDKKKAGPLNWTGPIMGHGKLLAIGSHGKVLEISPQDGSTIKKWEAYSGKIHIAPVIAEGALYLLSEDGSLLSYR